MRRGVGRRVSEGKEGGEAAGRRRGGEPRAPRTTVTKNPVAAGTVTSARREISGERKSRERNPAATEAQLRTPRKVTASRARVTSWTSEVRRWRTSLVRTESRKTMSRPRVELRGRGRVGAGRQREGRGRGRCGEMAACGARRKSRAWSFASMAAEARPQTHTCSAFVTPSWSSGGGGGASGASAALVATGEGKREGPGKGRARSRRAKRRARGPIGREAPEATTRAVSYLRAWGRCGRVPISTGHCGNQALRRLHARQEPGAHSLPILRVAASLSSVLANVNAAVKSSAAQCCAASCSRSRIPSSPFSCESAGSAALCAAAGAPGWPAGRAGSFAGSAAAAGPTAAASGALAWVVWV